MRLSFGGNLTNKPVPPTLEICPNAQRLATSLAYFKLSKIIDRELIADPHIIGGSFPSRCETCTIAKLPAFLRCPLSTLQGVKNGQELIN